ncbi:MAG: DUF559 domain-containing protein [Candidatus Gracilibacteria bacterium]|nr:DUF559 domain-containing protein [Candidatus Gracilibacteria bacterium]MDQ7023320.1 DUF559 domain-containing protein [Candidatus Gracilibacteria bacterium]
MNNGDWDSDYLKSRGLIFGGRYLPYNPDLNDRARELRNNMTSTESKIWYQYLNNIFIPLNKGEGSFSGQGDFRRKKLKVLRQKIIDNYIVDFYIPDLKLVIEIDGSIHDKRKEYDKIRTEILKGYGLKEIRILNYRIENNFSEICKKLDIIFNR